MPVRSLVGIPTVFCITVYLIILGWKGAVQKVAFTAIAISIFHIYYSNYNSQTAGILAREHDAATAAIVYQKIAEAQSNYDRDIMYPVAFYGPWNFESPFKVKSTSTAGASFFEWDEGNSYRAVAYMKLLGFENVEAASPADHERFRKVAGEMPLWPGIGSVQVLDGVTLVKMGKF